MRIPILLTTALSVLLVAASPSVAQTPAPADVKTFRYAYRVDPASLDPHALAETFTLSWLGQVYEPLVGRGKKLELVPALATKWEQPEPNVWRFHLRQGVKFADGSPFTAEDVIFSLQRVKKDGSDMAYTVASVTDIKKVDDFTVDLVMAKPNPILPVQITSTYMMSKAWAEKNGATAPASVKAKVENFASNNANGTGPFKIETRQAGVKTVLVPNANWWGEKQSNIGQVVFTPIQADTTRVAALLSGEVDMIYPVPQQDAARIDATGTSAVLKGAELRTMFLNMDQKRDELIASDVKGKNPFKDKRVRQAIYQAIDMTAIRDRVMGGTSRIAGTMIAPGINGYDAKLDTRTLPYDPEAAKKLLAEAGYPNGVKVAIIVPVGRPVRERLGVTLQQLAKAGGFELQVQRVPFSSFNAEVSGKVPLYVDGFFARPTVDTSLFPFLRSKARWNERLWHYSDETVDRALDAARLSGDPAVQKKQYIDVQAALVANPASFFAYNVNYACAYRKSVAGVKTHPMRWFDLRTATMA